MIEAFFAMGKWLIGSRIGRPVSFAVLTTAFVGGIWLHGYSTHKDSSEQDRLQATIRKQQDRIRTDVETSSASDRELCRRLGGGLHCDTL